MYDIENSYGYRSDDFGSIVIVELKRSLILILYLEGKPKHIVLNVTSEN